MGFFAGILHLEHGGGNDFRGDIVTWRWMDHHRRMHASKGTPFKEQNFAPGITDFLCRCADNAHRQTHFIGDTCRCHACTKRHGGNNVVATGVPDGWQAVVFSANGHV